MKKRTAKRAAADRVESGALAARPSPPSPIASSELTRDVNRDAVLAHVRSLQPVSRVDLARASGLQPSTVSSIVERLLEERWIRESAMVKTARGRRPTLLSLNDDVVFLVADVRPLQAILAVVDLNGRFLERQTVPMSKHAERSIDRIAAAMQGMRELHGSKIFQGIGVSMPGRVNPADNSLVFAPRLPWSSFAICDRLHRLLGLEVQLENASNASLLSELWFGGLGGMRNAMLVTVSEEVSAAILADGRLLYGQDGLAGEFGHIQLDPNGPLCNCGAHGCWQVYASSLAGLRFYREQTPKAVDVCAQELVALALDGEPTARAALLRQARAIGKGLHLLNAVLSPEVILLAGDVCSFYELFRKVIEADCRAGAMDGVGPRIVAIGDGEISRLRGAAAVVLQRHSGYYRAGHIRLESR